MRSFILFCMLCLTAPPTSADTLFIPERIEDNVAFTLSRAERVIDLVRKERPIQLGRAEGERLSDLRVSLIVLNNGPATDVSPRYNLHLAMFNVIEEHATAWALEPIAAVYRFEKVERATAGIYTITGTISAGLSECPFTRSQITIDARHLSMDARQAHGIEQFETTRIRTPMNLSVEHLSCSDH